MKHHIKQSASSSNQLGFTLIELMIVVTLIGIVSSMAYSAFTGYTRQADRAQATADLYEIAQIMERGYTDTQDYTAVEIDTGVTVGTGVVSLTFYDTRNGRYNYSIASGSTAVAYSVEAIPTVDSRDNYDLRINQRGTEQFRVTGTTTWGGNGWDNIPD